MKPVPYAKFVPSVVKIYSGYRYSPATLNRVTMVLRQLGGLGCKSTADLTTGLMTDYVTWLKVNVTTNHNTINGYLSAAQAICTYAIEEGYLERHPSWRRVRLPATPMRKNVPPTYDQAAELLAHLAAKTDWEGRRLSALAWLATYVGPRLREATYAHLSDLDEPCETFAVDPLRQKRKRTKTLGSARVIPLPAVLSAVLRDWRPLAGPTWLFPGIKRVGPWDGGSHAGRPLGRLQAAAREVGIEHVTFHSLRHAFGTFALTEWNLPSWVVQQVMGHASLRTTEGYLHAGRPARVRELIQGVGFEPRA